MSNNWQRALDELEKCALDAAVSLHVDATNHRQTADSYERQIKGHNPLRWSQADADRQRHAAEKRDVLEQALIDAVITVRHQREMRAHGRKMG